MKAVSYTHLDVYKRQQHGGQAIPNFDYGMAPGVAKSYIKHFYHNLAKAISLLENMDGCLLYTSICFL